MSLGERIRKYRKINKFTQKQLSSQLGLTPKMISFYERNERIPPIDIIVKLSEIFSVSTDYLLGLSPEQSMPNTQNSLSIEEKKIINIYRSLDKDYKDIILGELKKNGKTTKIRV